MTIASRLCCFIALAVLPTGAEAQQLSKTERRIVAYVDAHLDSAVALTTRLAEVNSGTGNLRGVRRVGDMLDTAFRGVGLTTRWVSLPDSLHRAGHLFAESAPRKRGSKPRGKRLLLIGHLDTVFEEDSPFQHVVRDGMKLRGPGTGDMKGGDVIMLYALRALRDAGALDGQVIVALTGDEESSGHPTSVSRQALVDAATRSDIALDFEGGTRDSSGMDLISTARRGSAGWKLTVTAKPGHSGGVFSEGSGDGAIYEAARILDEFRRELGHERYLTFNPGVIVGGTQAQYDDAAHRGTAFGKTNVIAGFAYASGDTRTISDEQLDSTRARMRAIVARHLPQTNAEIAFEDGIPAMPPTARADSLVAVLNRINRDMGLPPMAVLDPSRRGAGDISYVAKYVDGLVGLGATGGGSHSIDEYMDLDTFSTQIKRAAVLIYRLTR